MSEAMHADTTQRLVPLMVPPELICGGVSGRGVSSWHEWSTHTHTLATVF